MWAAGRHQMRVFAIVPDDSFTPFLPGGDVRLGLDDCLQAFLHRAIARMQDGAAQDPGGMASHGRIGSGFVGDAPARSRAPRDRGS
jgi:hypothetical protein